MISGFSNNKEFIIFGAFYCKYCKLAKQAAEKNCVSFNYIDVNDYDHILLEEKLKKLTKADTIPIIYKKIDGEYCFIGGFNEFKNYI